ncbi:Saccharopine dehydrogenase [Pseudocyphellaria aurata]|nr:Saccharopine dehydrogenase [Pseudocyphellaria aurata]
MKISRILHWKDWMSKIHPPLPMTPHESRKLLYKSKSSLQRRLDHEHPEVMSDDRGRVRQHFQSVLDNPLLSGGPKLHNHYDGHVKSSSQPRRLLKRPMDHFKDQITAGTASIKSASVCLTSQLQLAQASPKRPPRLQPSGAEYVVLHWMCDLPVEKAAPLSLEELELVKLLVRVITIQGDKDLIWRGIQRLEENLSLDPSSPKGLRICNLVNFIIKGLLWREIETSGLISAVDFFTQGVLEMSSTNCRIHHLLQIPGRFLLRRLLEYPSLIPTLQLNSFVKTLPAWSVTPRLHEILFKLHFPQCAGIGGVRAALDYLAGLDVDGIAMKSQWQKKDVVRLSLRVAELLSSSGSDHEARWVMEFLQTNFASEIGYLDTKKSPKWALRFDKRPRQRDTQSPEEEQYSVLRFLNSIAVP